MAVENVFNQNAQTRARTPIDRIAEAWLDSEARLDPVLGTRIGRGDGDDRFGDYSPEGLAERDEAAKAALSALRTELPQDFTDEVTARDLGERLRTRTQWRESGLDLRNLTVLETPSQLIRQAFDLMPKNTVREWASIARRLRAVPTALSGYRETLRRGAEQKIVPALRQVEAVAQQAERFATGYFPELVSDASTAPQIAIPPALLTDIEAAASVASDSYLEFSKYLRDTLAAAATTRDGVGADHYALATREFLGASVDPDESYEWGVAELHRISEAQRSVAREIVPGGSVADAIAKLNSDPARVLRGKQALLDWLQQRSDEAISELSGSAFDIPAPLMEIECCVAPTRESGIYYTAPNDDFTRPGRVWWTVPEENASFHTWRELTTVYHEGVPGHHLQMGGAVANHRELNAWRRGLAGTSGHFEGWALYAERLMAELGFMDEPGNRLGLLDAQRMRAARVVIDIGIHLGKRLPDGSGEWNAENALNFLSRNVSMHPTAVRYEVLRYLGWPGQAISYKLGERAWLGLREEAEVQAGSNFDLREFHARALRLGSLGLDTLTWAMRAQAG